MIDLILSKEGQDFIQQNSSEDTNKLYLKHSKNSNIKLLIDQIFIRKKVAKKLAEWSKNYQLIFNKGVSHEQASSQATAKLKSQLIKGRQLLDITGGMGVDHYYMSKSFEASVYAEKQEALFLISRHNLSALKSDNISFEFGDGINVISKYNPDCIYIDPARRGGHNEKLVSLADCEPNVLDHLEKWTRNGRTTLIKTSPMLDIKKASEELMHVYEIWVISHKNECKEVVYALKGEGESNPLIKTYNILANGDLEEFHFRFGTTANCQIADELGSFIYEPNASLQKSRGGDHVAKSLGLEKLHPDTSLYTSRTKVENFPGKSFKVINQLKPYDSSLKKLRLNVISRNYPDKANLIQQKLRLKPSQNEYLIACKSSFNNYIFLLTQQII